MSAPLLGPSAAQITMMGHNIAARIAEATRRRRRRRRLTVAGAVLGAGLALSAAGIGVAIAPPAVQASVVTCYFTDDTGGQFMSLNVLDEHLGASGQGRLEVAIQTCALAYGSEGVHTTDPAVCELRDLRLAVFPNADALGDDALCRKLGLGRPPS
jgi:hypothetical protein